MKSKEYLITQIRDTVVQDANDSEGTGTWANLESISRHTPAPTLTAAHFLRIASADFDLRSSINSTFGTISPKCIGLNVVEKRAFLVQLHKAVYAAVLCCFIQGLHTLSQASIQEKWNVNVSEVVRIWRAGCIIKSDHITDLFDRHYTDNPHQHPLLSSEISEELTPCIASLKIIILDSVKADACIPAFNASFDYLKYVGSLSLSTCFVEAQLDAFGAHGYQVKTETYEKFAKGRHHSNWSQ